MANFRISALLKYTLLFIIAASSMANPTKAYKPTGTMPPSGDATPDSCANAAVSTSTSDCVSGNTRLVKAGDDPLQISLEEEVSTRAVININGLNHNGTNLDVGVALCLPLPCTVYNVKKGQDCTYVAKHAGISLTAFKQYNLDIDGECDNLIAGWNTCISVPSMIRPV